MNGKLYKRQMQQLRPHEPVEEFSAGEDAKFTLLGLLVLAAPLGAILVIAGVIAGVFGLLR